MYLRYRNCDFDLTGIRLYIKDGQRAITHGY